MKIAILIYAEAADCREYDTVACEVRDALEQTGHDAEIIAVHDDVAELSAQLRRCAPELIFNLLEMFGEDPFADVSMPSLFEMLGYAYTGSRSGAMHICQDKALAKKLLQHDGVLTPKFCVVEPGAELGRVRRGIHTPLFVKPVHLDASIGIDAASFVRDGSALQKKVRSILDDVGDAALVEEFIEGREIYVGIVGNHELVCMPPVEIDFSSLPDDRPHFMDRNAKFEVETAEYRGTSARLAVLDDSLRQRVENVAARAYRTLHVRDYGRIDLRLTPNGKIYVIEVNPNCYLNAAGEFAMAARAHGLSYPALIDRIAQLAAARVTNAVTTHAPRSVDDQERAARTL